MPLSSQNNDVREFTREETRAWIATLEKRVSSAHVVLYTDSGRVLVVRNNYLRQWTFPGGIVDPGETPRAAAVREVSEEVGIDIDEFDLEFCIIADYVGSISHRYQFIFQARVAEESFDFIDIDKEEISEWELTRRELILEHPKKYFQTVTQWADGIKGYVEEIVDFPVDGSSDTPSQG